MAAVSARCQTRIMTDTPRAQTPRPDQITRFFDWIRGSGLNRDSDRWIAGVCGGIAARTGLDPLIVRGIAVVIAVLGGPVVFAYAVGWALMPRAGRIYAEEAVRGRFQPAMIAIGVLLVTTVVPLFRGLWWNGPTGFWAVPDWLNGIFSFGWGLAVLAGIVWLIVYLVRRARKPGSTRPGFGPFAPRRARSLPRRARLARAVSTIRNRPRAPTSARKRMPRPRRRNRPARPPKAPRKRPQRVPQRQPPRRSLSRPRRLRPRTRSSPALLRSVRPIRRPTRTHRTRPATSARSRIATGRNRTAPARPPTVPGCVPVVPAPATAPLCWGWPWPRARLPPA